MKLVNHLNCNFTGHYIFDLDISYIISGCVARPVCSAIKLLRCKSLCAEILGHFNGTWWVCILKHIWLQSHLYRCIFLLFISQTLTLRCSFIWSFCWWHTVSMGEVEAQRASTWGTPHCGARKIYPFFIAPLSRFGLVIDTMASKQGGVSVSNVKPLHPSINIISPWIRKDVAHKCDYHFPEQ